MANIVSCQQCGAQFDAAGYQPGVQFACSSCGQLVTVPSAAPPAMDEDAIPTVVDPNSPARARTGKRKKKKGPAGGGGGSGSQRGGGGGGRGSSRSSTRGGRGGGGGGGGGRGGRGGGGGGGRASRGGGGRGGRGRDDDYDDRRGGRGRPKSSNNTGVIVGVIGGVVVLLLLVVVMMSGGGGDKPVADDDDDAEADSQPQERKDPLEALRNHAAVKKAVERFFAAIQSGDQSALDSVFDYEKFTESMAGNAKNKNMEPQAFVDEYYSVKAGPSSHWKQYMDKLDLVPDMTGKFEFKGEEMWYWEQGGNGLVQYKATPKNGKPAYNIGLELKLDTGSWKVITVDDGKYKPWDGPQMYRVVFENAEYAVPEDEYLAHKDDYKAEKRKPPAPWDKPTKVYGNDGSSEGTDSGSSEGTGSSTDEEDPPTEPAEDSGSVGPVVPAGELTEPDMSSWAKEAWTQFERRYPDRAAEKVAGKDVDRGLSARLINHMAKHNNNDPRNLEGKKQVAMAFTVLQTMWGTSHRLTTGMGYNAFKNGEIIDDFKRLHVEKFGN